MKKIITACLLCLSSLWGIAGNGEGSCGVYLLVNGTSQNYRLTSTDWGNNGITAALNGRSELNGTDFGTIKSLVLCGGQMTAWANGNDYYEDNSFRVAYRVYKQGETAPEDWEVLSLNELTYRQDNNYRYEATGKTIDLRALTDERGGTWVFEAKMLGHKYWNDGNGSGSWDTNHDTESATFYLPEHYYVAGNGSGNWCGGSEHEWSCNYSGNEIVNGTKTFLNVASGNYMFKVTNGYWNDEEHGVVCNEYVYEDLDIENSYSCTEGDKGNICFTLALPSDVHILFANGKIQLDITPVYFVTSNKNSWATNNESHRLDPATNSITYNNMSSGNFHFRILNGKWPANGGTVWNYDNMDYDNSTFGYYETGDQNINIELEESADVTIHLNPETDKISVTSSLGYYSTIPYSIVGDETLTEHDWKADIVATEMTDQSNGTYRYIHANKFLSAGTYEYKVVANHRWDAGCVYPVGHGNNAQVIIEEDGTYTLTYTFAPTTKTLTCEATRQTENVTISAYGYSTFYGDKAFELPSGLKAMIFTGVEGDQLTAEELTTIPANTGVVLQGTANTTYTIMQTETDATYSTNLLKGTLADETIDNDYKHYILGIYNEQCGLFWPYGTTDGVGSFTNKAGKAYLELGGAAPAPAHVRGFVLSGTSVATGVEDVNVEPEGAYYDLLGRQVREPQPGQMYIQNGKKIVW